MGIITQEDRERIAVLLKANPRASIDRIAAIVGVSHVVVRKVARRLVEEGAIQKRERGGRRRQSTANPA
jgi:predicted ArsR family transcriptional regulator